MLAIQYLFNALVDLYLFVIFVTVILSWLVGFNVVNRHNQFVGMIDRFGRALTEPALRPIRGFLPNLGGIDISPILLIVGVQAVRIFVNGYLFAPLIRGGL
jgi:YggT family protein